MTRRKMVFALVVCFLVAVFWRPLLSQTGQPDRTPGRREFERMRDMNPQERIERLMREAKEREAQAMKQALGADEQQWKVVEPKLEKVRTYRDEAFGGVGLPFASGGFTTQFGSPSGQAGGGSFGGFAGGGFQFQGGGGPEGATAQSFSTWRPLGREPTQVDRICGELQMLLQDSNAGPEAIMQKLDALRHAQAQARQRWAQAQQDLREALNLHQQATLMMMGLLE
jgi:hypothetical protein